MTNKIIHLKGLAPLFWLLAFCCGLFLSNMGLAQNVQNTKVAVNATPGGPVAAKPASAAKPRQTPKRKKPVTKIVAKPDTAKAEVTPLDEMIVMGMSSQVNNADPSTRIAHPKIGWANFETYLRDGATSPDKKAGLVKVSFLVHEDGTCTDFKVVNSLSKVADQSAIKLIKNGPAWIGSVDGDAKETTVTVNFR